MALLHRPSSALTLRVGGGTGFKAPTIFVEEAEENGFQNTYLAPNVKAERSQSASFDANWKKLLGEAALRLNLALYLTRIQKALVSNEDTLSRDLRLLENASGLTLTRGGELSAQFIIEELKFALGYTYIYASQTHRNRTYELALNPRHTVNAVLVWESGEWDAKAGIEGYYTGEQRLERNPFRERSPAHLLMGIVMEKGFGHWRVFLNFENILDTRQTKYDPVILGNPQLGEVRRLEVYAPLEGRVVNGGIRFVL